MNAVDVLCPVCGAKPGWRCYREPGTGYGTRPPHLMRIEVAAEAAAAEPDSAVMSRE